MPVHFEKQVQVGALLFDKTLIEVPTKYFNYSKIFLAKNAAKFPENIRINEHVIELKKGKQPLFGLIYSLKSVELKILKIYIETNLANSFIWPFKSLARASILFHKKSNKSLCFYINYWSFNNITIKN